MQCPEIFPTESERLKALANYGLDNEAVIKSLDPVVRMAARTFNMPSAALNIIGDDHVFFVASTGFGGVDMRRDVSFCAHAINQNGVMVVPDAKLDERFHDNPLVTGEANLRFYAGVPIFSPEGLALGSLCVVDGMPHTDFSASDQQHLRELAKVALERLELRRIEVSAERTRPNFASYTSGSETPIVWFDEACRIIEWNDAAAALQGYSWVEKSTLGFEMLLAERERDKFIELIACAVAKGSLEKMTLPAEIVGLHKDGTEIRLAMSLFCWHEAGRMKFEAVLRDFSLAQREREELNRQANTDPLTGLLNRARFYRCVEDTLVSLNSAVALMIDIDEFMDVNDTLGPDIGDRILQELGKRLTIGVPPSSSIARVGGDEFAILIPNLTDIKTAVLIAESIIAVLAQPMVIEGHDIKISACCGMAFFPAQTQDALDLVSNADLALAEAKRSGRGSVLPFLQEFRSAATFRRSHGLELHRAVEAGEFMLFYQPQINLASGNLMGAEALIRWRHPERGILPPATFLPALEKSPLVTAVGAWLLNEACAQAAYWRRNGAPTMRMGVNLFGAQFRNGDLAAEVVALLQRHGLPPDALELEVTENIVLEKNSTALSTLQTLADTGVGVAFDDFGTGYASLSLLKSFPLTRIKIDYSFVKGMLASKRDAAVIRAILDMANSFDLQTIAEGIETEEQKLYLAGEKCEEGQGYLFSKPLSVAQFERLFQNVESMTLTL